jgi:hypothetical protein
VSLNKPLINKINKFTYFTAILTAESEIIIFPPGANSNASYTTSPAIPETRTQNYESNIWLISNHV